MLLPEFYQKTGSKVLFIACKLFVQRSNVTNPLLYQIKRCKNNISKFIFASKCIQSSILERENLLCDKFQGVEDVYFRVLTMQFLGLKIPCGESLL